MARRNRKEIEFKIEKTIFPGIGEGTFEGKKVRVKGCYDGQIIKGRYLGNKRGIGEIEFLEVIEKAPYEINPPCVHYDKCGGCSTQNLPYEKELEFKEREVLELFENNKINIGTYEGMIPSNDRFHYRNKMEYTFGDEVKHGELMLGMHVRKRRSSIVTVDNCLLVSEDFNIILKNVLEYFKEKNDTYYRVMSRVGFLRNLIIREGKNTGELMVIIVTTGQGELNKDEFINLIKGLNLKGEVKSIFHVINDSLQDAVVPEKVIKLYGEDYIKENLLGLNFLITPFSFFQTNTDAAERLYKKVLEYAGDISEETVFDLYCGTGTIGNILAKKAKKVKGVEIIEEAALIARKNSELNNLNNTEFIPGDVKDILENITETPNLIVLDPPRSGIHPKALQYALDFNAPRIIYVSCNPKTLVEDLKVMEKRYKIEKTVVLENYPNTTHVETVTLMSLK